MHYWVSTWKLDQIMQYASKQKTKSEKTPTDLLYWYNFFPILMRQQVMLMFRIF